jgi:hypothetical protein
VSASTRLGLAGMDGTNTRSLFVCSRQATLLEYFRIPYRLESGPADHALERIRPSAGAPTLLWPRAFTGPAILATILGADPESTIPVFARVLADDDADRLLAARDGAWSRVRSITDSDGREVSSIRRSEDGSVFLPFDPDEVILNYWSERYATIGAGAKARLRQSMMNIYYRLRPLLPRHLQIWMRRRFARLQARSRFPRWPVETCLHDFFDLMLSMLGEIAGEPLPYIASWPGDHTWALVLTHDVEHARGFAALDPVLDLERAHGLRSAWNLVPRRYHVDDERVRELVAGGFEVGVHGLHHDGRDLESIATLQERLPGMREAAERWGAVGFRSPAMHRNWDWIPLLGFDYDSSCPDTDPFEPQAGGCCTWLPFFNQGLVELPLTMVQDHTLFVILRQKDETAWVQKAELLRGRGGLAMIDTHPDYLLDERLLRAYGRFLAHFAADPSAWKALPREVSAWWRKRAASHLEWHGDSWRVVGPAAEEGRVQFHEGAW